MGEELDFDGQIFEGLGDYLTLAEYYHLEKNGLLELQRYLQQNQRTRQQVAQSAVHRAIVELGCDLIYTTNFDGFLEQAHQGMNRRYRAIRGAKSMVDLAEVVHIVKLHGDLFSPKTMVFTETSYFERLSFESPLDLS